MIALGLGVGAFVVYLLYDVNSIRWNQKLPRSFFTVGTLMLAAAAGIDLCGAYAQGAFGGAADILITVRTIGELQTAVNACRDSGIPFMLLGNGSNLLVSDDGIEGAAAKDPSLAKGLSTLDGNLLSAPVAEAHDLDYTEPETLLR